MSAHVPINNIIPFSLVDGPGARTSIFLQGCNIRCKYCHNPETQALCNGCGDCVAGCPSNSLKIDCGAVVWDPTSCIKCDQCINVCEYRSSPRIKYLTAEEVFDQIKDYAPFIRGISTSGGECMLYPQFLLELFTLAKSIGLGCLIDSNGTIDFRKFPELMEVADGVMLDVKAWDDEQFILLTGKDGKMVRQNLDFLNRTNKLEEIRIIVTEGYNDPEEAVKGCAQTLGDNVGNIRLRLMKFRNYGVKGVMANAPSPTNERMQKIEALARDLGFKEIINT